MAKHRSISIVGAGNLASGLAVSLHRAGYRLDEVVSREAVKSTKKATVLARRFGARAATLPDASLSADILIMAVPDGSIAECAKAIAARGLDSPVVLHCSGALGSDE